MRVDDLRIAKVYNAAEVLNEVANEAVDIDSSKHKEVVVSLEDDLDAPSGRAINDFPTHPDVSITIFPL